MTRPARLFLAILVAILATALAPVAPALATYGKIKVVKDLVPSSDSGRFDLKIDGSTVKSSAGDGDSGYNDRLSAPNSHSVSETASSGTLLPDYDSSIKCTKSGSTIKSGSGTSLSGIPVKVGDYIICTITNTRKPPPPPAKGKVEIEKQTDPAGSDASFGFTAGSLTNNFSLSDDDVKTVMNVTPNQTYTVTEPATTGWHLTNLTCSDADSSSSVANRTATIKVAPGETVRCTFFNKEITSAIKIVKTGPAEVHHGDTMTFSFAVTTPGNSPLHNVHVKDDHCAPVSAAPTAKNGGNSDDLLEPGETWIFTCTMPVPAHETDEEDPIHNVATATGDDEWERTVIATDDHDTDIIHPAIPPTDTIVPATPPAVTPPGAIQVLGQQALSGRATLRGQTGCASRVFTATVSGRQIRRVTFYVDGRRVSQVSARRGRTRFTARINPAGRRLGVHRVTARVVFAPASGTRARTLVLAFQRCGRQARPVFTG